MLSAPFPNMPRRGDKTISADFLNQLAAQVASLLRVNGDGAGIDMAGGALQLFDKEFQREWFIAKVTSESSGSYAWTEQQPATGAAGYEDRPDGRSGTTTVDPAKEMNNATGIAAGTMVLMFPGWHTDASSTAIYRGWRFVRSHKTETAAVRIKASAPVSSRWLADLMNQTGLTADWTTTGTEVWVYNTAGTSLAAGMSMIGRFNTDQFGGLAQVAVRECCDGSGDGECPCVYTEWPSSICLTVNLPGGACGCIEDTTQYFTMYGGGIAGDSSVCAEWINFAGMILGGSAGECLTLFSRLAIFKDGTYALEINSSSTADGCQLTFIATGDASSIVDCTDWSLGPVSGTVTQNPLSSTDCECLGETVQFSASTTLTNCTGSGGGGPDGPCIAVACGPGYLPATLPITFGLLSGSCAGDGTETDLNYSHTGGDGTKYWISPLVTIDGSTFNVFMSCGADGTFSMGTYHYSGDVLDGVSASSLTETSPGIWTASMSFSKDSGACEYQAAGSFDEADCVVEEVAP